jgi:hypothetical protein
MLVTTQLRGNCTSAAHYLRTSYDIRCERVTWRAAALDLVVARSRLSTSSVPVSERFEYWMDMVCAL